MGNEIRYTLHYEDFEGAEGATTPGAYPLRAARRRRWRQRILCGPAGASDKPPCTPTEARSKASSTPLTSSGHGQGIAAGEMAELIRAMRHGYTYANVHTTLNPAGLVRGQIAHRRHGHNK